MAEKAPIEGPLSISGQPLGLGQLVRRRALHEEYGGNPQSGISVLGSRRGLFLFTGASGERHGYTDSFLPDGTYRYYGEGQRGDMRLTGVNKAIDSHRTAGNRLFLFDMNSGVRAHVLYKGEFALARRGQDRGPDRDGTDRQRYYFDLESVDTGLAPARDVDTQILFDEGRDREITTNRPERNRALVAAAKRIHGTVCQVCEMDFDRVYGAHGAGFIEVHHLHPIATGPRRVDARKDMRVVCSNCHRMLHRGAELLTLEELRGIIEKAGPS